MRGALLSTMLLCGVSMAAMGASSAVSAQVADGAVEVEELVVTARKREERLQDVPLAVTALGAQTLAEANVSSFTDFARSVPSLAFSDYGTGRTKPAIRGVSVNTGAAVVGFYIDETPIPATGGTLRLTNFDPDLYDLNRVEVLRGPQGTLYGAGSMGGTIKLIPNKPDPTEFAASMRALAQGTSHGGFGGEIDGMVNAPLIEDKLALRAVAWARYDEGFIDRRSPTGKKDRVPEVEAYGFRLAAELRPTDWSRLTASVFRDVQKFNGFQTVTFGADNPNGELEQNFLFDTEEPNENRFTLYNFKAEADSEWVSLLSSTSYYDGTYEAREETGALLAAFVGPTFDSSIPESNRLRSFTQEVRLSSAKPLFGTLDWVVGAFYERTVGNRLVDYRVPEYVPILGTDQLFFSQGRNIQKQNALFGELSWHVTDTLTVTGGLRWYDFEGDASVRADGPFNGGLSVTPHSRSSADGVVKKLNVAWQPNSDLLFYATAAEGFRAGFARNPILPVCELDAINAGIDINDNQVEPDKLWNYEVGAKTSWLDRRLVLNAAAFRIKWSDIQQGVFLPCGFNIPSNAGDATLKGVELETVFKVTNELEVGGNVTYTDTGFDRVTPGTLPQPGDPMLDVPEWQGSVYGAIRFDAGHGYDGLARLEIQHTGEALLFYGGGRERPALTLVNGRLQFSREDWTFALYGRNLTNQVEIVGFADLLAANLPDRPRFTVNRPRTVGVELSRKF